MYLQSGISPSYFYLFDHKISFGIGEIMSGQPDVDLGISHGEDITLLLLIGRDQIPLNDKEMLMSERLLDMLLEFNQKGHLLFSNVRLNEMDKNDLHYLKIKKVDEITVEQLEDFGNGKFWDEVLHDHVLEN